MATETAPVRTEVAVGRVEGIFIAAVAGAPMVAAGAGTGRGRARAGGEYTYFILLTGHDATEENQRAAADAGVDDFLTKPLNFEELWNRLRVAERILRYATQVRQLEEMMPICSYCKKIRDDKNYWQQIEGYINERTGSEFSHSVCPECYQRVVVPELEMIRAHAKPSERKP